jgi:meiotic recombination protein SPO11
MRPSRSSVITESPDADEDDDDSQDKGTVVVDDDEENGDPDALRPNDPSIAPPIEIRRQEGFDRNSNDVAPAEVIRRIDLLVTKCIDALDDGLVPILRGVGAGTSEGDGVGIRIEENDPDDDEDNNDYSLLDDQEDEEDAEDPGSQATLRSSRRVGIARTKSTANRTGGMTEDRQLVKKITLQQCRSYTSLILVLSYCHQLLLSKRTTTLREVYYAFVTHFRNQPECNAAVAQASRLLGVPRHALGLKASPRGWFCGDVQFVHLTTGATMLDGRSSTSQGYAVTSEWLDGSSGSNNGGGGGDNDNEDHVDEEGEVRQQEQRQSRPYRLRTCAAQCIVVIEKEGVYQRLVEDGLHHRYPCILVTSRGFPDFATRAVVSALHRDLDLPVYGLCDCNPYGVSVLNTFCKSGGGTTNNNSGGGGIYFADSAIPMQWMGLRASQVEAIRNDLPDAVFQAMTDGDVKRLESLMNDETSTWINDTHLLPHVRDRRLHELQQMLELGYKVELEALHWLGMEYLTDWVGRMLERQHDWPATSVAAAASPGLHATHRDDDDETSVDDAPADDDPLLDVI